MTQAGSRAETARQRYKRDPSAALQGIFDELCPCGHKQGDHAAFRDRERGGWPCLEPGCACLVDAEGLVIPVDNGSSSDPTREELLHG